jgi:hypothetical protein
MVSGLKIDSNRSDFVFAGQRKIDAVDEVSQRLGAMLFEGSINVSKPVYLGTFTLRASADAAGAFGVGVQMADNNSFLKDARYYGIGFFTDGPVMINVGTPERIRTDGK